MLLLRQIKGLHPNLVPYPTLTAYSVTACCLSGPASEGHGAVSCLTVSLLTLVTCQSTIVLDGVMTDHWSWLGTALGSYSCEAFSPYAADRYYTWHIIRTCTYTAQEIHTCKIPWLHGVALDTADLSVHAEQGACGRRQCLLLTCMRWIGKDEVQSCCCPIHKISYCGICSWVGHNGGARARRRCLILKRS